MLGGGGGEWLGELLALDLFIARQRSPSRQRRRLLTFWTADHKHGRGSQLGANIHQFLRLISSRGWVTMITKKVVEKSKQLVQPAFLCMKIAITTKLATFASTIVQIQ